MSTLIQAGDLPRSEDVELGNKLEDGWSKQKHRELAYVQTELLFHAKNGYWIMIDETRDTKYLTSVSSVIKRLGLQAMTGSTNRGICTWY